MLHAALQRCVSECATIAGGVTEARVHPGITDAKALARASIRVPGLLLSCLALVEGDYAGGDVYVYQAALSLYVIQRDQVGSPRLVTILDDLIVPLLGGIPGHDWGGDPWSGGAGVAAAETLYSTEIDDQGVALWVISWDQAIRLPRRRPAT
jgi:hypothetical protein